MRADVADGRARTPQRCAQENRDRVPIPCLAASADREKRTDLWPARRICQRGLYGLHLGRLGRGGAVWRRLTTQAHDSEM